MRFLIVYGIPSLCNWVSFSSSLVLWCGFSLSEDLFLNLVDKFFLNFSGIFPKSVNFLDSLSESRGSSYVL